MSTERLISIVDDDVSLRDSLANLIRSVGFRSRGFASADAFLASGVARETACLILDVRMPRMNGLELQRRLVAADWQIPIIFITSHTDDAARARALADGAVAFLYKPCRDQQLFDAIEAALNSDADARKEGASDVSTICAGSGGDTKMKSQSIPAVVILVVSLAVFGPIALAAASEDAAIRPFRVDIPQAALDDLRQRLLATRWPNKETVPDRSQGTQLAKIQELVRYWGTSYDWRKLEAKLNALPQFMTTIDGLDIHFIHVRSRHPSALPVIVTHGWPGSVTEQLRIIAPLTDPTAHGGGAQDAFDVVIPSMPGYGFSGKPTGTGWNPDRIARAWAELMRRLGYRRYVAQGGDWGSPVSSAMARHAAAGLLGIHINLPATVPPDVAAMLAGGGPAPAGLSEKERAAFDSLDTFYKKRRAYAAMMGTRPQVIGQALTDSPAGLAAFMYDYNEGEPERLLTKDDFLDNVTLYWLTNSATSSARLYWETSGQSVLLAAAQKTAEISLPVAITVFPEEVYRAPETWARRAYRNLIYFREVDKGGHFAAWEQPELFAAELRAAFRSLRPAR